MPQTIYSLELNNAQLDILKLKKALHILRAINHPLRQQMVKLIDKNERMTVTEIYTHFKIEQAVASQHLAILRKAGFVSTKKESKFVHYTLSYNFIQHFSKTINQLFSQ